MADTGRRQRRILLLELLQPLAFIIAHIALVILTGFGRNMGEIILGQGETNQGLAIGIGWASSPRSLFSMR